MGSAWLTLESLVLNTEPGTDRLLNDYLMGNSSTGVVLLVQVGHEAIPRKR